MPAPPFPVLSGVYLLYRFFSNILKPVRYISLSVTPPYFTCLRLFISFAFNRSVTCPTVCVSGLLPFLHTDNDNCVADLADCHILRSSKATSPLHAVLGVLSPCVQFF